MSEDFHFDTWAALAARDPAAFEVTRRQALDKVISRNPGRLRRLQWRVDAERRRARTPLKACLVISGMMWDAFADLRSALDGFLAKLHESRRELRLVTGVNEPAPERHPTLVVPVRRHAANGPADRECPLSTEHAERQDQGATQPSIVWDGDTLPRSGGAP